MNKLESIKGLTFLEEKHYYKVNNIFIPSVSSILRPISKQIYGDIDPDVLKKAADRGTEVHLAVEIYDNTGAEIISDEYVGYLDAYKKFRADYPDLEVIATEYRVYDPALWYAGTVDKIFYNKTTGKLVLVDLKTSFNIEYAALIPQLTGYKHALKAHGIVIDKMYVLHLKPDNYEYKKIDPDFDIFISCMSIQRHIKKHERRTP